MNTIEVEVIPIEEYEVPGFFEANAEAIDYYAKLRARGVHSRVAFMQVFGLANSAQYLTEKTMLIEGSPTYQVLFDTWLKITPVDQMLSEKKALQMWMENAQNPYLKGSERNTALKEACVIAGITTIDDAGRTRKVPTLNDLYPDAEQPKPEGENPAPLH